MSLPAAVLPPITAALEAWFHQHGRDYPWRQTQDPYAILVSEVMLQQTQITTVLEKGYYQRWLQRFPDWKSLADAADAEILLAWQGLGYYRRARNLRDLAICILEKHGGCFPTKADDILALPGVGPYTAGAVASFAFDLPEPIVDGNVARVLARLTNDATPIDSTEGKKRSWELARQLVLAAHSPRIFNSAIMELGQAVCRPQKPMCLLCPVKAFCTAKEPEVLPIKSKRFQLTEVQERVFFHRFSDTVLLQQEQGSRRTGLWKLPALPEGAFSAKEPPVIKKMVYGITRYKVTLSVHKAPAEPDGGWPSDFRWIHLKDLPKLPMPSPYRKALEDLLNEKR